jgi:hypothetical protein
MAKSILYGNENTKRKEKILSLSPAFSKQKESSLLELAKGSMKETLQRWIDKTNGGGGSCKIELINEINILYANLLLKCAFGDDCSNIECDYWHNGIIERVSVSYSLRQTYERLIARELNYHLFFFPSLA